MSTRSLIFSTVSSEYTFEAFPLMVLLEKAPDGTACANQEHTYHVYEDLPKDLAPGRYLLHVRTIGGALNRLFTNMWTGP